MADHVITWDGKPVKLYKPQRCCWAFGCEDTATLVVTWAAKVITKPPLWGLCPKHAHEAEDDYEYEIVGVLPKCLV